MATWSVSTANVRCDGCIERVVNVFKIIESNVRNWYNQIQNPARNIERERSLNTNQATISKLFIRKSWACSITETRISNKIHFMAVKMFQPKMKKGYTFLIFCSKHRLWLLVRTNSYLEISAQNIHCGYSLEAVLMSTRNLCFTPEMRKIIFSPENPWFSYTKWGLPGSLSHGWFYINKTRK